MGTDSGTGATRARSRAPASLAAVATFPLLIILAAAARNTSPSLSRRAMTAVCCQQYGAGPECAHRQPSSTTAHGQGSPSLPIRSRQVRITMPARASRSCGRVMSGWSAGLGPGPSSHARVFGDEELAHDDVNLEDLRQDVVRQRVPGADGADDVVETDARWHCCVGRAGEGGSG